MRISKAKVINAFLVFLNIILTVKLWTRSTVYLKCETMKSGPEIMDQTRDIATKQKSVKNTFTCENIQGIKLGREVAKGFSQILSGIYYNISVMVKISSKEVYFVHQCKQDLNGTGTFLLKKACKLYPSMMLLMDILINDQMQQASVVRMLGYCVRGGSFDSKYLKNNGVFAVFESWDTLDVNFLKQQAWPDRIKYAIDISILLNNFERSPLGSLAIVHFNEDKFVLVNNFIKFSEVGDVSNIEPSCIDNFIQDQGTSNRSIDHTSQCEFGLQCVAGVCKGHNAKKNLYETNNSFFRGLLESSSFPLRIRPMLSELQIDLDNLVINSHDLVGKLQTLRKLADYGVI